MSTFWLGVPGILSGLGPTWAREFAARLHKPPCTLALPYAYMAGAIGASGELNPLGFEQTVADVAELLIRGAKRCEIVRAAGHSHGPMVLLSALLKHPQIYLDRLTLIAAAVPDDCELSGLNKIAEREQVAEVDILYSPNDTVLRDFGGIPGYGQLGLHGPRNISPALADVLTSLDLTRYECGHGGYFAEHLEQVFGFVTR